jgi:Putative auto-transporter adhesin, head GIN domain
VRRLAALALAGLAALAAVGCGPAPVTTVRDVAPFTRLAVAGGVRVAVVRGAKPGVSVHGRPDVIDRVEADSSGGRLRISVHDRGIVIGPDPLDDVRVQVTVPRLGDVQIEGSGDVDLGDVSTRSLHFSIQGAGNVTARGTVDRLVAVVHGAGDANFGQLAARDARVEIHGAASVDVDVSRRLDVEIQGAGEVRYTGRPRVTQDIRGAGDVTHVAR